MTARILDGKAIAEQIRVEIAERVADFIQNNATIPCLAAVVVGDDPASAVYVRNKRRACERVGIESQLHRLPNDTSEEDLLALLAKLNKENQVHGILVQLPLPKQIAEERILGAINPVKDVDAFHPENIGRLVQGRPRFLPCTPHGVQQLLVRSGVTIAGAHAVIVGRSDIVGKPLAIMLAQRSDEGNATVTVCHSRTRDLPKVTALADILVVAIGQANFVTGEMVKPGATVVDVGINRTDTGLVGDVDFDSASQIAGRITPVPGGVGPMTVTMLLENTLRAAQIQEQ